MTLRLRESERFRLFATQFRDLVLCRFAFCVLDDLRGCFAREVARPHSERVYLTLCNARSRCSAFKTQANLLRPD